MSFVVCRVEKLKNMGKVGQAQAHNLRLESEANRPHLNTELTKDNILLFGSMDLVGDVHKRLNEATKNANGKFRLNAVLACEMVLSASPEYFTDKEALEQWTKATMDWLKEEYGNNLVNAVLHMDESTPHIQAIIVPIDSKNKLNCRAFFSGKAAMQRLQDKAYEAVKHLGIDRGISKEITGATHKKTSEWRKENVEKDKLKDEIKEDTKSITKAIDNIEPVKGNLLGYVKVEDAHLYYTDKAKEQIKTVIPKKINYLLDLSTKLKNDVKKALKRTQKAELDAYELDTDLNSVIENFKLAVKEIEEEAYDFAVKAFNKETYKDRIEEIIMANGTKKLELSESLENDIHKEMHENNMNVSKNLTKDAVQKAIAKSNEIYKSNGNNKNTILKL